MSEDSRLTIKERWFLVAVVLCSLILRLIYLAEVRHNPFFEHPRLDALFHDIWAQGIASGDVIGNKVFFRAPFYPYFLAAFYAVFGHNYVVPRIAQHLLGILSLVVLYLLARRLFGIRTAVAATLLASFNAILIYFEGELLFDSLLVLACLIWLLIIEKCREQHSPRLWLWAGIVYGVICCIRPPFLAIAPLLFGGLAWNSFASGSGREGRRIVFALVLGCLLPILPITIRNYIVGNDLVLIAYQGGVNFFIGNNPEADGHSSMMPGPRGASWENRDETYLVEKELGHPPSPSEESWFWYKKGIQFMVDEPLQYASLLAKKAYLFWNWYEIPNNQNFYSFRKYSALLRLLPIGFWLVGPLGLLGIIMAVRERRNLFPIGFVLSYAAIMILFFVCDRFRLPIVPFLCIFGAYALVSIFDMTRRKEWRRLVTAGVMGTGCVFLVNSSLYDLGSDTRARDLLSVGIVNINTGHYADAVDNFREAAASSTIPPPNLCLNWGVAEWQLGHTPAALEKFTEELRYYPDSYGALNNISSVYLSLGKTDSAMYFGTRAIQQKPYLPKAYLTVALAYQKQHQMEDAATTLEHGLKACGENFSDGVLLLAGIDNALGRSAAAESLYSTILLAGPRSVQPSYEPDLNFVEGDLPGQDATLSRAKAMYGLGHIWAGRRALDSAVFYFHHATLLSPGYADAWADLGVALMQERRFADADSALQQALRIRPDDYLYWYNYGTLMGVQGHLSDARAAFERALSIRADFEPAREKIELIRTLSEGEVRPP